MEKIWNGTGITEIFGGGELVEVAKFKIDKIYFSVLQDKKAGKYETGWIDEMSFDEVFNEVDNGMEKKDFKEISIEAVLGLLNK